MITAHASPFRRTTRLPAFLVLACVLILASTAQAADTAFKDPYNGGMKLSPGGGLPGRAYTAFIDAAYRKDYRQVCTLMAEPGEVDQCVQQTGTLDSYIALFTQPKNHKVLGGYLKGPDATLQVAYTFASGQQSTGVVVMKQTKGKWLISSFGGSGSGTVSAEAGGQKDLAAGTGAASVSGENYTGPAPGAWTFEGKDSKGVAWTGTLTIAEKDSGGIKYIDCSLDVVSRDGALNGVGSECTWDAAKRQVLFGPEPDARYSAVLSADGRKMTQGTWTEAERDWSTQKVHVKKSGTWSAAYAAGQADAGVPPVPAAGGSAIPGEFAIIDISASKQEYIGTCPVDIVFTATITFRAPFPDSISSHWEFSDGRKTPDKVVKTPRNGHLSLREGWKGGKPGEERKVSVRFFAESGGNLMVKDPPGVKVTCK